MTAMTLCFSTYLRRSFTRLTPVWAAFAVGAHSAATAAVPAGVPLTRDEAIVLALQHNQRIKVSSYDRGIARANVLTAYGRFDPSITFERNYSENEVPITATPLVAQLTKTDNYALTLNGLTPWGLTYQLGTTAQNERGTFNAFSNNYVTFGGVTITQPLLRGLGFGATLADLRIAKANRAISDWEHRQTVIDIVTSVILAYEDVAEARDNLRIAERSRDLAAQLVNDNEKRNRIGSISDADVTQARARAANRDEQILITRRSFQDRENRLRELIGEPVLANDRAVLTLETLVSATPPPTEGAVDLRHALEWRPDYQAAKLGITIRRESDLQARNQRLPRVDFVGSYGYNGVDRDFAASRAQVRDEDHRAYSAGVVVSVPLTFAEGRGRARAARLALRQSEADLVRLEQDIAVSLAAAIGQMDTATQRVAATDRAYQLAQQALDAEQKRFRAGTSSTFLVLQLQEQLASVESSQVRAIADQRRAIANYERELGATLAVNHLNVE
jgi:outer membrane protein